MVDAYMRGNIGESGVPLAEVETRWNAANASEDWVWKGGAKAQTLAEVWSLVAFLFTDPADDEKSWRKVMKPGTAAVLAREREVIAAAEPFDAATLEADLRAALDAEGVGAGKGLQPIRVAITGTSISPGIFESLVALGRERSLQRIDRALERLAEAPAEDSSDQG